MAEEEKKQEGVIDWQAKAEEYLNGWKRAQADYQNREKEIGKEREVLRGFFEESIISEFLPVLDNLKNAFDGAEDGALKKGIGHVIKQFEDVLNKFGVQKIDVLGKDYDPTLAEAVDKAPSSHEATNGEEGNKVIKVVADGYRKSDRIIRAARVIVG